MRATFLLLLLALSTPELASAGDLTLETLFPHDRVLDVQISLAEEDWDTIRNQARKWGSALGPGREKGPFPSPYTYVEASITIDGVEFPRVGLRKKGFLGSQSSSGPSLKINLNQFDSKGEIDGLSKLTFNNNRQDSGLLSQFMGYSFFNAAGSPASRCAYANITVNGTNLGIYCHVEPLQKTLLKRAFGNSRGTLYEGTVVDFDPGWENGFEHKRGDDTVGREKIARLTAVLNGSPSSDAIGEWVDLDSFYRYWALESLLGFWDGYTGNRNNYFFYLNPTTDKFHFLPWGADCMFEKYSKVNRDRSVPLSVKTVGLVAHRLYQLPSARERYQESLRELLDQHWNEAELQAEVDRVEALLSPYVALSSSQKRSFSRGIEITRKFIRARRADIEKEIADGMPIWTKAPSGPVVLPRRRGRRPSEKSDNLWNAARQGDVASLTKHLSNTDDINKRDRIGSTALSWAAGLGKLEAARLLIREGADVNAPNADGTRPLDHSLKDIEDVTVEFLGSMFGLDLDADTINATRSEMAALLREHGGKTREELRKMPAPKREKF